MPEPWQWLPKSILANTAQRKQAATWAAAQRSQLASMWADNQRQKVAQQFAIAPRTAYQTPGPAIPMAGFRTQTLATGLGRTTATATVGPRLDQPAALPPEGQLPTLGIAELAPRQEYQPTVPMPFGPKQQEYLAPYIDPLNRAGAMVGPAILATMGRQPVRELLNKVGAMVGPPILSTIDVVPYAATGALSEFGKQRQAALDMTPGERAQRFPSAIAATAQAAWENAKQSFGGEPIGGSQALGEWGIEPGPVRDVLGFAIELIAPVPFLGPARAAIKGVEKGIAITGRAAKSPVGKAIIGGVGRLAREETGALRVGYASPQLLPDPDTISPAVTAMGRATEVIPAAPIKPLAGSELRNTGRAFIRAWFNRNVDVDAMQELAQKMGVPMTPDTQVALLNRLNPDMAAKVKVDEALRPALEKFTNANDRALLTRYIDAYDVVDKARAIGARVEKGILAIPLKTPLARQNINAQKSSLRLAQRRLAKAVTAGDAAKEAAIRAEIATLDAAIKSLETKATRLESKAIIQRTLKARTEGGLAREGRVFSGDIKLATAERALADLRSALTPEQLTNLDDAAGRIWQFGDDLLEMRRAAGIISDADYLAYRQAFPHYVPIRILDYMDEGIEAVAPSKKLGLADTGIKALTEEGTKKVELDPIYGLVRQAYATQARVNKNNTFNAFVRLLEVLPDYRTVIKEVASDYRAKAGETKISGFVKGEAKHFAAPREWNALVEQFRTPYVPVLSDVMSTYRALITSRNPFFLARNAYLDMETFFIREYARAGANPLMLPRIAKELVIGYYDSFGGLMTGTYKRSAADLLKGGGGQFGFFNLPSEGNLGEFLQQRGGLRGVIQGRSPAANAEQLALAREAEKQIRSLTRQNVFEVQDASDMRRIIEDILTLQPVEAVGGRIELAPRVASYRLAKARGASELEAVIAGRTVTIDFAQGGNWSKVINTIVPFFNVGMQAMAQPVRAFRENQSGAIGSAIQLLAIPTIVAEAWNRSDPERAREYDDVSDYIKQMGIVVMLPGVSYTDDYGNKHPGHFQIRTREFTPVVSVTRQVVSAVLGGKVQSADALLQEIIAGTSPISPESMLAQVQTPVASTAYELASNYDIYRKRAIATNWADQQASALSKGIVSGVQAVGGDWRPSQVDYAIRDILGGVGKVLTGQTAQQLRAGAVGYNIGQNLQTAQDQVMSPAMLKGFQQGGVSYRVGPVSNTIGNLRLTIDEQAIYQQAVNELADKRFQAVFADPRWKNATPEERTVYAQRIMDAVRDEGKLAIPSLQQAAQKTAPAANRVQQLMEALPP